MASLATREDNEVWEGDPGVAEGTAAAGVPEALLAVAEDGV